MHQSMRAAGVLASVALIVLASSACSAGKRHIAAAPLPAAASSGPPIPSLCIPPAPTSLPTYSQYPVPASVRDDPDKRKQVHIDSCSSTGSGASAAGTIHNSGSQSASYDITVFFTSNTATAVNYATSSVTVGAGAVASFTAARTFAAPAQLLCVLAGVS